MARKTYRGADIAVSFDLDVCTHAGECVRGLPKVFDTERRPWILPDEASAEEIRAVVAKCPSGALELPDDAPSDGADAPPDDTSATVVTVSTNGPVLIRGSAQVVGRGRQRDQGGRHGRALPLRPLREQALLRRRARPRGLDRLTRDRVQTPVI